MYTYSIYSQTRKVYFYYESPIPPTVQQTIQNTPFVLLEDYQIPLPVHAKLVGEGEHAKGVVASFRMSIGPEEKKFGWIDWFDKAKGTFAVFALGYWFSSIKKGK